jgi:hypothetical protein
MPQEMIFGRACIGTLSGGGGESLSGGGHGNISGCGMSKMGRIHSNQCYYHCASGGGTVVIKVTELNLFKLFLLRQWQ